MRLLVKVSVIVSTHSMLRAELLFSCISSLQKQILQPEEILLVLEPDRQLEEFYSSQLSGKVRVIVSSEGGLSSARNAGVRHARGDVVAFIDDDAVADKEWLRNLVMNYDDDDIVGTGGPVEPVWENGRPAWFPSTLDWIVGCTFDESPREKELIRSPIGCNMSFRRRGFEVAGYFTTSLGRRNKSMIGSEETEFCLRLYDAFPNARIVYDPTAIVHHWVPSSRANANYLIKRSFYEGYSKALMTVEHSRSKALIPEKSYLRHLFLDQIPSCLRRIYKLDQLQKLAVILLSLSSVLVGYATFRIGSLFTKRNRGNTEGPLVSDKKLTGTITSVTNQLAGI